MTDLKVERHLLEETERNLHSLKSEFSKIKARTEHYDSAFGSPDIVAAMGDFSGNWDYHRRKLLQSIENLGKLVHETNEKFHEADEKLKKAQDAKHKKK